MKQYFFLEAILLQIFIALCETKLVGVIEMFRHGARNGRAEYFDIDPTYRTYFQKYIEMELTPVGMRQHYLLGKQMREKYIINEKLLADNLDQTEIYIETDDYNRTARSANCHLQGMFPLKTGKILPDNLDKKFQRPPFSGQTEFFEQIEADTSLFGDLQYALPQQINIAPIHMVNRRYGSIARDLGKIYHPRQLCKIWNDAQYAYKTTQEYIDMFNLMESKYQLFTQIVDKFKTLTNTSIKDINAAKIHFHHIMSLAYITHQENLPFPIDTFTENDLWSNMENLWDWVYTYIDSYNETFRKIDGTPYLNYVKVRFDNLISTEGTPNPEIQKFYIVSAHDTTLKSILNALKLTTPECNKKKILKTLQPNEQCVRSYPVFASNFLFELHQDDSNQYYVKGIYNNEEVKLCNNQVNCYYEDFVQLIRDNTVENFDEICQNP